jgi:PRTRC genetic system protein B
MNTSVSIGSSQDFRLSRVLLVYGTSSYDGFPYRHPFVTLHEVVHDREEARLGAGQLVTPEMLIQLTAGLGQRLPLEILPERVMVRTTDTIVWWAPAQARTMFYSDRGGDATLKKLNGRKYPQPALLFKASGSRLWVRALAVDERPLAMSCVYMAPYWNCGDDGLVCTGTMKTPREKSVQAIESWEDSFFQSEFTHANGVQKHTTHPGGFLAMWQSLAGKDRFPFSYLVKLKETLEEFASNHDRQRQNANPDD